MMHGQAKVGQHQPSRSSLAWRLRLALAAMLLPVAAVAAAGLVTFRQSISALEEFRRETVEESKRIEEVRDLLVQADDLGESRSRRTTRPRASGSSPQGADRPALRRPPDLGHAAGAAARG
jgi:hypothetical protein